MSEIEFDEEITHIQNRISETPGFVLQRFRTLEALNVAAGERVLDVGCGSGHMLLDLAAAVGEQGRVEGLDESDDMLEVARRRCHHSAAIKVHKGDLYRMPFVDATFDAACSVQVFEYVREIEDALSEIRRVLRPGGRVLIRDTDWTSVIWKSSDQARMKRVLDLWDKHLVDPHLPQTLATKLRNAGFRIERTDAVTNVEIDAGSDAINHYLVKFIAPFVVGAGMPQQEVDEWVADLAALESNNETFFSLTGYMFVGTKE